ncbi:MAG: hypothetical protein QOG34_1738 [Frankiaceae bacterium]|jgi:hypothetical protein|nr:hypothetical protein [Frankiaceae bacterium]
MIRTLRRLGVVGTAGRYRARPVNGQFFAAGWVALAALAPTGVVPIPTLPAQDVPTAVTAGVVLTAVDSDGQPLAYAQFEVYRADQPEGEQQPLLAVPVVSSTGTVTVPLPAPAAIPDAASNYYAVSSGVASDGASASGIDFFNLTSQNPIATATITPNLSNVPTPPIPSVTNIGQLPPVGNVPQVSPSPTTPPVTGPCGFKPDTEHPPPPAFTITTKDLGTADGTVNVGVVYGAGSWPGNTGQADVRYTPYRAMGESLESEWSRATESSVVLGIDFGGETQTKYSIVGNLHFTLAASDVGTYSGRGGGVSVAGQRARAFVVPATWQYQTITFHCNSGDHKTETRELWKPHEWNPHASTSTPDYPTVNNTFEAMQRQSAAVVTPMEQDQWNSVTAGQSESYNNGYGAEIGAGPVGLDFTVESQSTDGYNHKTTIYSASDCGPVNAPLCFYWAVDDAAMTSCPWEMACGTDYYAAVYKTPPAVPVAPQPCSKYEPHGACD